MSSKQTSIGQCFVSIVTDAYQLEKMLAEEPLSERKKELLCNIMSQVSQELSGGLKPSVFHCYLDGEVEREMIQSIKDTLSQTNSCFAVYSKKLRDGRWRFEWRRTCGLGSMH